MTWIKPTPGQAFHIQYGAHTCKLSHDPPKDVEALIREKLSYEPKDAGFVRPQQFKGKWQPEIDPRRYLYNRRTREFPTGLLPKVDDLLGGIGVSGRPLLPMAGDFRVHANPRHYQRAACAALVSAGRGTAILPTGTGKTLLCAMLSSSYPGRKVLITTPNRRLLHQNREEIERFTGEPVGILGDAEKNLFPDVIVSTIQSLVSRIEAEDPEVFELLTKVEVWICDESHGAASDSYRSLSRHLPNCHLRFSTTATWMREDGCELVMEGVLGDVVYQYTYEEAFNDGFLTPVRVWFRDFPHDTLRGKKKPNYAQWYKQRIVDNTARNLQVAFDAAQLVDLGLSPCLVLVRQIEHGNQLAELLNCPFVNGEQRTRQVDQVLQRFTSGEIPVLVASGILNVGVNLRELRSAVNAAGGDSRIEVLQKIGRGLRLLDGKEFFDYVDYNDREPNYFKEHSSNRRLTYKLNFPQRLVEIPLEKPLVKAMEDFGKPRYLEDI